MRQILFDLYLLLMTLADNPPLNNICIALVLFVMLLHRTE